MKKNNVLKTCFLMHVFFGSFLFLPAQVQQKSDPNSQLLQKIKNYSAQLHLSTMDIQNALVSSAYIDRTVNAQYVYLQQAYQRVKVRNAILTIVFRNDSLSYSSGDFIGNIENKLPKLTPRIAASQALLAGLNYLNIKQKVSLSILENRFDAERKFIFSDGGVAANPIEVELVLISPDDGKTLQLAWNVNIAMKTTDDWWNIRIDAQTGSFIEKDNWTVHESKDIFDKPGKNKMEYCIPQENISQVGTYMPPPNVTGASYRVVPFPYESPKHGAAAVVTNPWLLAGATNNATTYGWHFDGTTNYTSSRGNNVYAFEHTDTLSTTGASSVSTTAVPTLTFDFTPDFTKNPSTVGSVNQKFAITNLFYWNNLMHDVMYQYGFDEASGNFQNNNIIRGGTAADYVNAQAQDGSGTDNANFSAPVDGQKGTMRMYIWTAPPPTLLINSPASIAASYDCYESIFSTSNKLADIGNISGDIVYYKDDASGTSNLACSGAPVNSISGKIALIMRGTCNFTVKVKNAQNAGAKAVIMINNVSGNPVIMSGTDNSITIPAVMVTDVEGQVLIDQLNNNATVNVTLATNGQNLDGDLDNGVVCHEYGHGVSIRLTGGPSNSSCLNNAEEAGEGWSDYLALMMTTDWSKAKLSDDTIPRTIATYAAGQAPSGSGIRLYPYTTDLNINPHNYSDLANSGEVHDIGEVWCSALWDMTWFIIHQTGLVTPNIYQSSGTGGNIIALKLVLQGLKLQKCSPGFIDSRNAILAADSLYFNKAYRCAIWNAFARRGMGLSAVQGLSRSTSDQTAAYDLPNCTIVPLKLLAFTALLKEGNKVSLNWQTENEINTVKFVLQKSVDGINWVDLFEVKAKQKYSNTYQTVDFDPVQGTNYYRVKILDKDQSYTYSAIETIKLLSNVANKCFVVPNPTVNFADIHFSQPVTSPVIEVFDAKGMLVKKETVMGPILQYRLVTSGMAAGVYTIRVKNASGNFSSKLIVSGH